MKSETKKLVAGLLINSVLIISFYFVMAANVEFAYLHYVYLLLGAGLGLAYVIYNRGFVGRNLKPEDMPADMPLEDKHRFIEDCALRLKKSRWMLTVIIPIVLTFAIDIILLYTLPTLEGLFG